MPDASRLQDAAPLAWSDAFAAMPMEAPPADAWSRTAATLPDTATPRITRVRWAWAIAATLAVAVPGAWFVVSASHEAPASIDEQSVAMTDAIATPRARRAPRRVDDVSPHAMPSLASATGTPLAARASERGRVTASTPARRPGEHVAMAHRPRASKAGRSAPVPVTNPLDGLLTESARLEALVAIAHDDPMQNASAVVLAADAEDRLRTIDAALTRADLTDAERLDLWTRRVDALRELAGIEGTQRWLASKGESFDDAIVRVD